MMSTRHTDKNNIKSQSTGKVRTAERIRKITATAMFTALLAVSSLITIPAPVPFTMQTFAVFCALFVLGGKYGSISIALYLCIGAAGAPVFSGFGGGLGALLGVTGGYLCGFLLSGLLYWLITSVFNNRRFSKIAAAGVGLVACYAFGTAWFMAVYNKNTGSVGIWSTLMMCVLPFVVPDILKIALAGAVAKAIGNSSR